ncbi:aminotransferase class V-fold PLP-dependent enzyme [Nicoliella lavandulae]|uniref:cysteine desulfurase n=1 Tax=Nicoliella lavandulae TaxID=3082954 RepID=A0ABU8SME8_9LACO
MLSEQVQNDFPFFNNTNRDLVYLDNAATTQKPQAVIEAIRTAYVEHSFNVHRSVYTAAQQTTDEYEAVRAKVARFINATSSEQIIFTKGTTDGINLVANGYFKHHLHPGDEIVVAISEHHSNLLPWLQLAKTNGLKIRYIELASNGRLNLAQARQVVNTKTKLVAIAAVSNVLGTINPVVELSRLAHQHHAQLLVDAAQAAPELKMDVAKWDADWVVWSAHKMLGPTGVGILYGKQQRLAQLVPEQLGGEMVDAVSRDSFTTQPLPWRLEAGTPNIAGVIGFGAALDYLNQIGMQSIQNDCQQLGQLIYDELTSIDGVEVYGPTKRDTGIVTFNIASIHSHDVASALDLNQIAVRAGYHCAEPLMKALNTNGAVRASAYFYNSIDDAQRLINAVKSTKEFFIANANE